MKNTKYTNGKKHSFSRSPVCVGERKIGVVATDSRGHYPDNILWDIEQAEKQLQALVSYFQLLPEEVQEHKEKLARIKKLASKL